MRHVRTSALVPIYQYCLMTVFFVSKCSRRSTSYAVHLDLSSVRNSRGMHSKREHLPSPVKKRILWSSPLKGMERPVRLFTSFIQTVPPNPGVEIQKPLPPIPSSPQSPESEASIDSPLLPSPDRGTSVGLWQAPTEWGWDLSTPPTQPFNTTTISPNQKYLPILQEPSPGPFDLQGDMFAGVLDTYDTRQGSMDITVDMDDRPEPPPRNPSRLSISPRISGRHESYGSTASVANGNESSLSHSVSSQIYQDQSGPSQVYSDVFNFTHSYRSSDASTTAKAFASLDMGSPRNSQNPWQSRINRSQVSQGDESDQQLLVLRGKNLRPFVVSDLSASNEMEVPEVDDKLQQLSFSQDYHDVLAHGYHGSYPHGADLILQSPRKEQEMIPRPLAWRKSSGSSSSGSYSQRKPSVRKRIIASRPKRIHKKMSSWVPLQHLYASDKRPKIAERAPGQLAGGARSSPRSAKDVSSSKKSNRFPNLLAHAKGFRYHNHRPGSKAPTKTTMGSSQQSSRASASPILSRPSQSTTPLLRLPGGLALVRRAPSDTLQPGAPKISYPSPFVDTQFYSSYIDSPFPGPSGLRRPSSSYSQSSAASPVAPGMAIYGRTRNSTCSWPSHRPHSSTSSLPTSPLAHEIFLPPTPPQHLPKPNLDTLHTSQPILPLSTTLDKSQLDSFFDPDTAENSPQSPHKLGLLHKAKDVRDAWKRHQKDARQEKLKQSIRVLGPVDIVGGSARSANREASVLVGSEGMGRRVLGSGYRGSGFI